MTGTQSLVGLGGLGLVLVNFWTSTQRTAIHDVLAGQATSAAHKEIVTVGGELVFVAIATALAGLGGSWATAIAVAIVGLWVLWLLQGPGHEWAKKKTTTKGA